MAGQFDEDWSAFEQDKTTSLEERRSAWPYFDSPQDKSKSRGPEAQSRTITVTEHQPHASTTPTGTTPTPRYSDKTSRQDRH